MTLSLFQGIGLEIEYAIVDRETLDVRPVADELLRLLAGAAPGEHPSDHEEGPIGWSNELVLHVLELKNSAPSPTVAGLAGAFQKAVERTDAVLAPLGACLLPGGVHPWMDPERETLLWPHEGREIYESYDRIFGCRRHGWANVQATHVNLPFAGDAEFGALHAAARLVLPLLPAIAASSPVVEGRRAQALDQRLAFYRTNSTRIPSLTAATIPEPVFTIAGYRDLLERVYADVAPHDPGGILRAEWVNARGAIARFDRSALELRLLDTQECPAADVAVAAAVSETCRALVEERWAPRAALEGFSSESLAAILEAATVAGPEARIEDRAFLAAFGYDEPGEASAGDVWRSLVDATLGEAAADVRAPLEIILGQGTLAQRILAALGEDGSRERLRALARELCGCLREGKLFGGVTQ